MSAEPREQHLAGITVAVTASRRAVEQGEAFERKGARVIYAPTVRVVPTDADEQLKADTRTVIDNPPHMVLVTTGYGLKGWLEAAESFGLCEQARAALSDSAFYVRGSKGRGAVRSLGFEDSGMAVGGELTRALVDLALEVGVDGKRVLLQQHGKPDAAQEQRLVDAGAQLMTVVPHRWEEPEDLPAVFRLIEDIIAGRVDALTFTAAPAVEALLGYATEREQLPELVAALREKTVVASVGSVTSVPLQEQGIDPVQPERSRMGAMIKALVECFEK
ncbi:uroporphyrinogen-III synthase [Rothia sp. ZJ932]|uniref:uroporphyrinogen-III synthase n=1 Tax=Rothia sp. ZJ932 TaxID=2810516 RepID=UPI00196888E3|nr:uroporphyrinogen-III synthase [Rothia sp. ZJ932]QRZ61545.1 uroporphyrinogen-III synthase [Rothia sp. ZJ932]